MCIEVLVARLSLREGAVLVTFTDVAASERDEVKMRAWGPKSTLDFI